MAIPREAPPPAPVPKAASPAWPDDAARAFAADFARAYLSYSPSDPTASITALQAFVAPGLASTMAPQFGDKAARQVVGSVSDAPSFAAPPARATVGEPVTQAVPASEQSAIQDVVSRFLGGDAGGTSPISSRPGRAWARWQRSCSW